MSDALTKRLISSAFIVALTLYAIFKGSLFFFVVIVELMILVALYEYFTMVEQKGIYINKLLGMIFGGSLPLFFYFPGESTIIGFTILSLFLVQLNSPHSREKSSSLISVSVTLLGILFVAWFFSFLPKIRCLENGREWVFFLIFVTKMGDAAAYFWGTKYGVKKLMPDISPNKSVEGAIAGLIASVLCASISKFYLPEVAFTQLFALGIFLGILAQLGDLAESLIKRDVGVKDSGVIPGLGGVLDILDSLLFTAPFLFYYLTAVILV